MDLKIKTSAFMNFKFNDRVSAYGVPYLGGIVRAVGDVVKHDGSLIGVHFKNIPGSPVVWVHPKQCRRIKKRKPPRSFWIKTSTAESIENLKNFPITDSFAICAWSNPDLGDIGSMTEFREVRKK